MKLKIHPALLACLLACYALPASSNTTTINNLDNYSEDLTDEQSSELTISTLSADGDETMLTSDEIPSSYLIWGGGDGSWDATDAWSEDGAATSFIDNDNAIIGQADSTDGGTITIDHAEVVASLGFQGSGTWVLEGEGSLTASSLTKDGDGDATISAALTGLSDGITVTEGSLTLSSETSLGESVGLITVSAGAELTVESAFTIDGQKANIYGTATFNGHVTVTNENFVIQSGGSVIFNDGLTVNGEWQVNAMGDITFGADSSIGNYLLKNGGTITLSAGVNVTTNTTGGNDYYSTHSNDINIVLGSGSTLTETNYNLTLNGAAFNLSTSSGTGNYYLNSFTMTGDGASLSVSNSANFNITGSNSGVGDGDIYLSNQGRIYFADGGTYSLSNDIYLTGVVNMIDVGGGSLTLNGNITYLDETMTSLRYLYINGGLVIGDDLSFTLEPQEDGTYTLLAGVTSVTGDLDSIEIYGFEEGTLLDLTYDSSTSKIYLTVGGITYDLAWSGGDGNWSDSGAWLLDEASSDYTTKANVTIGSQGETGGTITLTSDITANNVTVEGANNYTLTSSDNASLTVLESITKDGDGTLTIDADIASANKIQGNAGELILNGEVEYVKYLYLYGADAEINGDINYVNTISIASGSEVDINAKVQFETLSVSYGTLNVNTDLEGYKLSTIGGTNFTSTINVADGVTMTLTGAYGTTAYSSYVYNGNINLGEGAVLDDRMNNVQYYTGNLTVSGDGEYIINSMTMKANSAKSTFTLGSGASMTILNDLTFSNANYKTELYIAGDMSVGGQLNKTGAGNTEIYIQNGGSLSLVNGVVTTRAEGDTSTYLIQVMANATLALGDQSDSTDYGDTITVNFTGAGSTLKALDEVTNVYSTLNFSTTNTVNWEVAEGTELIYHSIITSGATIEVVGDGDVTLTSAGQSGASLTMGGGELTLTGDNSFTQLTANSVTITDGGTLTLGSESNVDSISGGTIDASTSGNNEFSNLVLSNTTVKVSSNVLTFNSVTLNGVSFESTDGSTISIAASNLTLQEAVTFDASENNVTTSITVLSGTNTSHTGMLTLDLSMTDELLVELAKVLNEGGTFTIQVEGMTDDSITLNTEISTLSVLKTGGTISDEELTLLLNGTSYDGLTLIESYYDSEGILTYTLSGSIDIIPEPSTATLSLLALAGLLARRRRK